jgi:plasmid stabilization system protein ParE
MAFEISWTENALKDYENVIGYLIEGWSTKIAEKFIESVENKLQIITIYPFLGIASSKEPSIRSILLSKHNRLYYRISGSVIEILDIFDLRQDPGKNKNR